MRSNTLEEENSDKYEYNYHAKESPVGEEPTGKERKIIPNEIGLDPIRRR